MSEQTSRIAEAMPKAGRREWLGLAVIALPCMLYSMDLTVLNLAVPQISAELKPSATQLLWIVDIYGFLIAGALITMGTLGDRIGRRKLLMIGAVAFGAASILAAFSTTAEMLIVARALLGVAAATLAPSTLSLIRNMFLDPKERTFAIGIWVSSFSVGGAVGPLIGGLLLTWFWWGSVFLIAVPVMVLLLILAPLLLPEYRDPRAGRLDIPSAVLSLVAVLAIIYGIKHLASDGFAADSAVAMAIGVVFGVIFVWRQRRLADPLIDLSLFAVPAFSASLLVNMLGFSGAFGSFLLIAQYLQLVMGFSPFAAGLVSLPSTVGFILCSVFVPRVLNSVRPAYVMAGGYTLATLGYLVMAQAGGAYPLAALIVGTIILWLGLAPVIMLATDLVIGSAPPERAGSAAGLAETTSEFGGALGIAILGSIATAIYRGQMVADTPDGIPASAAMAARDTIGGAIAEAEVLGGPAGDALRVAAQAAYTNAFEIAAVFCAFAALAAAIVAVTLMRGIQPPAEPVDGMEPAAG